MSVNLRPLLSDSQAPLFAFLKESLLNKLMDMEYVHIGIISMVSLILGLVFFTKLSKFMKILLGLAIAIILAMCLTNMDYLQNTIFEQLQFIWRLNGLISIFAAFVLGEVVSFVLEKKEPLHYGVIANCFIVFILVIGLWSSYQLSQKLTSGGSNGMLNDRNYEYIIGRTVLSDYLPKRVKDNQGGINDKNNQRLHKSTVIDYEFENKQVNFQVFAKSSDIIDTFVPYYKGNRVSKDGKLIRFSVSRRGTVSFESDAGKHTYSVKYVWTMMQKLAWLITILTWIALAVYGFIYQKNKVTEDDKQILNEESAFE